MIMFLGLRLSSSGPDGASDRIFSLGQATYSLFEIFAIQPPAILVGAAALACSILGIIVWLAFVWVRARRMVALLTDEREQVLSLGRQVLSRRVNSIADFVLHARPLLRSVRALLRDNERVQQQLQELRQQIEAAPPSARSHDASADRPDADTSTAGMLRLAIRKVERRLEALADSPDAPAFEDAIGLRAAVGHLRNGLESLRTGKKDDPLNLAELLLAGLDKGWLNDLLRAQLVLDIYAPRMTDWSALAQSLSLICGLCRASLIEREIEILAHPLLCPIHDRVDIVESDQGMLRRIEFVRRTVRQALGSSINPDTVAIDCLTFGARDSSMRISRPRMALYRAIDWQASTAGRSRE